MSLLSRLFSKIYRLPPALTHDIEIAGDIPISMPDGVVLLANHFYPHHAREQPGAPPFAHPPVILVRSPYGRGEFIGTLFGELFAERGFQVLIQSCRGTFGSGGDFQPFVFERADGLATVAWLKEQPWFPGQFAMLGPSYLGFVQWAIGADAGPELSALCIAISGSRLRDLMYPGGTFSLETALCWQYIVDHQEGSLLDGLLTIQGTDAEVRAVANRLPLASLDKVMLGKAKPFFGNWLEHNAPDDSFWKSFDMSPSLERIDAPVHLIGGYYDIFLPRQLADFKRLEQAGKKPYLTLGPWHHMHSELTSEILRQSLQWLGAHLLGDKSTLRDAPVRLFITGAQAWREYSTWPPPGSTPTPYYLQPQAQLSAKLPPPSKPDTFRYDPHDPTPSVGGPSLNQDNAGIKNMKPLETRNDILLYTSAPMEEDLEIIGPVYGDLYVQSNLEHTDFLVRVCDVSPGGKSINLCEGILRLEPGKPETEKHGAKHIQIEAWATGHCFKRGHRIRVHVGSGAHPCFARNLGGGEALATGTKLYIADQRIYHDPERPSAVVLPVMRNPQA